MLLRTLAASKPGGSFLEMGTGAGLGTCWLLDGMDAASSLVSVDNDPSVQGIARDELRGDPRVEFVSSEGAGYLERCQERFDFIFADTWAGKYSALERCLELVKPGGFWVIDDMLPQPNWPEGHGEKAQDLLSGLDRLTGFQVTRLSWSTGLAIAVKR